MAIAATAERGLRTGLLAGFIVALGLGVFVPGAEAAERRAIVTEGADYFGRDIGTLKDVTLDDCEAACVADLGCKAFTYNVKAGWCFMKADYGDLRQFAGAISGRIVEGDVVSEDLEPIRVSELTFVSREGLDQARALAAEIARRDVTGTVEDILAFAVGEAMRGELFGALEGYKNALALAPERFDLWEAFAAASLAANSDDWSERNRLSGEGVNGAILAYLRAATEGERARALSVLSSGYAKREEWRSAIKAARASLAVQEDPNLRATLDDLVAQHGFRVVDNTVDTRGAEPRICVIFSDDIDRANPNITDFVAVEGGERLAVEAEAAQICASGVEFGRRYRMTVRQGLPARDPDERLENTVDIEIYVRDRDPQVRFVGKAYVLPRHAEATIPVVTVNVDTVEASVVRIGDRGLVQAIGEGTFLSQMAEWQADDISARRGEAVWSGTVVTRRELNREVTTGIPVGEVVKDLKPGVYAMTARGQNDRNEWGERATQWFIVTDMGVSTMTGNDGLHAVVRSLSTAGPVVGAELQLLALNNEVLGTATTDAEGYARFDAGLVRGTGGNAPALLVAGVSDGDFAFLDLTKAAFDLTDRGVDGREPPKPIDVFMTTERGVYRPGETVHVTTLMRDSVAMATPDLPMTLVVTRPDGVEYLRRLNADEGAGGRDAAVQLPDGAMRGSWRADAYTDPKGPALASVSFLVEDFLPERIDFTLTPAVDELTVGETAEATVDADWLYGAPAANLVIEGEVYVTRADGIPSAPGYRFGLAEEEFTPVAEPISGEPTAEDGTTVVQLVTPDVSATTLPLKAAVHVRVLDTNGRPVERRTTLPVATAASRIGVDPLFDDSVEEGGNAAFNVRVYDPAGEPVAAEGLKWVLSKVNTRYQWYNADGSWSYEPVRSTERVGAGTLAVRADEPARIESPVEWGEYALEIEDPSGALVPVSITFEAGWYVAPSAQETPDLLKISLDKPRYRVGDTVTAFLEPRFPGVALVSVVDDRLITMKTVDVPEGGTTVELSVTADWGPGAYVTATLIRPLDVAAKRMPSRAIGIAHAAVEPGDRLLDVALTVPLEHRPRTSLPVEVTLANVAAGEEAFVTLAAVDVGILNLTQFAAPAPEDWYFAQRRLGMELRDVYGQLIDSMAGTRGEVRSGGDGSGLSRLMGPPPTERLVAFFQGVTKVDADGKARADFDIPDFNGTVRVMAVAWSPSAVGHASADVLVRDPVVVQAALPNFLAPGDVSRLRLDLTHVQGPTGDFTLDVSAAGDLVRVDADAGRRTIALGDKASASVLVPLTALGVGDETITVSLVTPDGATLVKTLTMPVRANEPPVVRTSEVALSAGNGRLTIGEDLLADLLPGTGAVTVTVGGLGGIDLPGLVRSLDKYPYGCAEQITSRALPLVYLDDVVLAAGLTGETPVRERVEKAVGDVLVNQASNGSFGLWGPGADDLWLDAYVTDFLTRAKEKGFAVPVVAFDLAVTNLKNRIAYAPDFESGGEDVAYALYVLARNGRASIGDLRYYAETKLEAFSTPLAKAQLGAALALYGDGQGAARVFRNAVGTLEGRPDGRGWRSDYGSDLRDGAAILTLASESRVDAVDLDVLSRQIRDLQRTDPQQSTQEQAWMLLAANALLTDGRKPVLSVDGIRREGVYTARFDAADLAASAVVLENLGDLPNDGRITVTGVPVVPEPAGGNGWWIERRYYDLEGTEIDPSNVELGTRMVVVVTVGAEEANPWARLMIDDPLPAGFVIDNPNLLSGADVSALSWLELSNEAAATEFRGDRFTAALDLRGGGNQVSLGYMVRAVAPGTFAHPAAIVEDMYRPHMRARTDSGSVSVSGDLR